MKDMTQEKASRATEATKGMGESVMGKAQQGKEQTGSFLQQVRFITKYLFNKLKLEYESLFGFKCIEIKLG